MELTDVTPLVQLGGTVVIAAIALGVFLKIHVKAMTDQSDERKTWYTEQGKQAERVARAIEELARSR